MILALTWSLAVVSCALPPLDGSTRFEGKRISKVTIVYQGRKWVDEERLRRLMTMKKGSVYSGHAADADIKSLYESGLVDDVVIRKIPDYGKVRVQALITTSIGIPGPGPHVAIVGNSTFSDQRLFNEGFKGKALGRLFIRARVETAGRRMEAYYHRMGFTGATVALDVQRSRMWPLHPAYEQTYHLQVEEGPKPLAPVELLIPSKIVKNR